MDADHSRPRRKTQVWSHSARGDAIEDADVKRRLEQVLTGAPRQALAGVRLIQVDNDHAVVRAASDAAIVTSVSGGTESEESEVKDAIAEVFRPGYCGEIEIYRGGPFTFSGSAQRRRMITGTAESDD